MIEFRSFIFPMHAYKWLRKVLGNEESYQNGQMAAVFPDQFSYTPIQNDFIISCFRFQ